MADTGTRDSRLVLLLGAHSWVDQRENGIRYALDAARCMFSSGNVSEKLRVARFECAGETVVDLFAGIGYFTLPYLIKSVRHSLLPVGRAACLLKIIRKKKKKNLSGLYILAQNLTHCPTHLKRTR